MTALTCLAVGFGVGLIVCLCLIEESILTLREELEAIKRMLPEVSP